MPRNLGAIRFWSDGEGYFHSKKVKLCYNNACGRKKTGLVLTKTKKVVRFVEIPLISGWR